MSLGMTTPTLQMGDLAILTPAAAAKIGDPDLPAGQFHLVMVIADRGRSFDYEHVDSGDLCIMEALAILITGDERRIYAPHLPGRIRRERAD